MSAASLAPRHPAPHPARRPSGPVFAGFAALGLGVLVAAGHALWVAPAHRARLGAERALVAQLGLSDLALFTEARYARHPALADLATAFQDHPAGFDHFPSGSVMPAPPPPGRGALGFSPQDLGFSPQDLGRAETGPGLPAQEVTR